MKIKMSTIEKWYTDKPDTLMAEMMKKYNIHEICNIGDEVEIYQDKIVLVIDKREKETLVMVNLYKRTNNNNRIK